MQGLPVIAAVGSTALKAGSSVMAGRAQAQAYGAEAAMATRQAKDVDLQSLQSSERRREDLRAALSAITAQRAARGLSLDTPTAVAIEREIRRQSVRDEGVERLGFLNQSSALRMSAAAKRRAATNANRMGWMEAAGTIMQGAGDISAATRK